MRLDTAGGTLGLLAILVVFFVSATIAINAFGAGQGEVVKWTMELGKDAFIALITYLRTHDSSQKQVEEKDREIAGLKAEVERLKGGA